jgi:hypothetical protein
MAYREVAMWEILAVLERAHRGESRAAIARVTGHSRKTVRRYLATAREVGWEPGRDPPTEALAAEVYRRHRPAGAGAGGGGGGAACPPGAAPEWLTPGAGEKRGLKLTKVQRLLERQGIRIPYSSLHRFAVKHCDFGRKGRVTVRMAPCAPGELAEVDFGRLGLVRTRRRAEAGWPGRWWWCWSTAGTSTSMSRTPRSFGT